MGSLRTYNDPRQIDDTRFGYKGPTEDIGNAITTSFAALEADKTHEAVFGWNQNPMSQ